MAISKQLRKTLLATLLKNTKESAETLKNGTESKGIDAWGLTAEDYEGIVYAVNNWGYSQYAIIVAIVVKSGKPMTAKNMEACSKHIDTIRNKQINGKGIVGLKSLSVFVSVDLEKDYGGYTPNGKPLIYTHSEKGNFLDPSGAIGNYSLQQNMWDEKRIRLATPEEIEACVKDLNTTQQQIILSHQYFSEVRNALLIE